MVEHAAVNRGVEGSSPSSGAILKPLCFRGFLLSEGPKKGRLPEELPEEYHRIHNPNEFRQNLNYVLHNTLTVFLAPFVSYEHEATVLPVSPR